VGIAVGVCVLATLLFTVWLARALRTPAAWLQPRPLTGAVARVSVPLPAHGVGRIAYTAGGKRCSMPAKSEMAITVGTEVAVVELERGVAVVVPLCELHIERNQP
jgi:hypothetical protein